MKSHIYALKLQLCVSTGYLPDSRKFQPNLQVSLSFWPVSSSLQFLFDQGRYLHHLNNNHHRIDVSEGELYSLHFKIYNRHFNGKQISRELAIYHV